MNTMPLGLNQEIEPISENRMTKQCQRCILPTTYPGIKLDQEGVCNYCHEFSLQTQAPSHQHFLDEGELSGCIRKYCDREQKYDVLVPVSGGVDSCFTLITLVEKFKMRPLVFHNDHGWDSRTALCNVEKLCRELNVDLLIWKNDLSFMRRLFKYFNESDETELSACFVCGNMLYLNGLELADHFNIPLVLNGYSKGQAAMMHDKEKARELYGKMLEVILETGDRDFFDNFCRKWKLLDKQTIYHTRQDLERGAEPEKILFIPFFVFKFYKTDKEALEKICRQRFQWQPMETSYPARTTNCQMIWLNSYRDLRKRRYTHYHDEYSTLIRAGEISRDQALRDLEFNSPAGLLERLGDEIGLDWEKI